MNLTLYAHTPLRRWLQVSSDLWFVLWTVLWIWLGRQLYELVQLLAKPASALESGSESIASNMTVAGDRVAVVPLISDGIRTPFDRMSDAATAIAQAGRDQQQVVGDLALFLGIVVAAVPITLLLIVWLPRRIRFVRHATASVRFIDAAADLDLFALRALARQPMTVLAAIDDDPAGAWRRGDPDIVRALAAVELKDAGLRPPAI